MKCYLADDADGFYLHLSSSQELSFKCWENLVITPVHLMQTLILLLMESIGRYCIISQYRVVIGYCLISGYWVVIWYCIISEYCVVIGYCIISEYRVMIGYCIISEYLVVIVYCIISEYGNTFDLTKISNNPSLI